MPINRYLLELNLLLLEAINNHNDDENFEDSFIDENDEKISDTPTRKISSSPLRLRSSDKKKN